MLEITHENIQKRLDSIIKDPNFFSVGRRNNDAVNISIYCEYLGICTDDAGEPTIDLPELLGRERFIDYVRRCNIIRPYFEHWNNGNLLDYLKGNEWNEWQ